jgi:hypothetical protein
MEADWEFEVGGEAPVIEALWMGFVDLRQHPERARELPEAAGFPALAAALQALNAPGSPVWTSKCDTWPMVEPDQVDPGELDAEHRSFTPERAAMVSPRPGRGLVQRALWPPASAPTALLPRRSGDSPRLHRP